jgi:glycosyltransferase involved in cell wall biosynthesis
VNIVQITPGAGAMYCGNCLRDNALVAALRKLGHQVMMVPLYLPLTLDEQDQSAGTPIFFGGINVYLEEKSALFSKMPGWFHDLLAAPRLLKWAAGKAAKTRAADLGELTLSMLRGEEGRQARELDELVGWLKSQPKPDVICLSNALLLGLARRLKSDLGAPVVCMLQGEDIFLDALPETQRALCCQTLSERAAEVELFISPSRYFGELMRQRLGLRPERVRVVYNGINLDGYGDKWRVASDKGRNPERSSPPDSPRAASGPSPLSPVTRHLSPVLGYFARMCREKGLDTLVEAYLILRRREGTKDLKLRVAGGCGPADEPFVKSLRERLQASSVLDKVEFHPNLDRAIKLVVLHSLSVLSVPANYGEAFGLYVIEALAAGVPVVQPRIGAFPELIEATGGGVLCAPGDPQALADAIQPLLLDPAQARALGEAGRRAVFEKFSAEAMAREMARAFQEIRNPPAKRDETRRQSE